MKKKYSYLTSLLAKKYVALFFILLLGLFLRLYKIDRYGLWYDEQVTLLVASGIYSHKLFQKDAKISSSELHKHNTLSNVLKSTINDNGNSILYNVILHFWISLMDNSEFNVRVLSTIFDLLTIYYMYLFARKIFSEKKFLAPVVCIIGAFNPLLVSLAQEARAYSLATLLGVISSYYFFMIVHLRRTDYRYFVYYALSVLGMLLCHYLSVMLFLAHFVIFLLYERAFLNWLRMFLVGIFVAIVLLVWLCYGGMEGYGSIRRLNQYYVQVADANVDGELSNWMLPLNLRNLLGGILQNWLIDFGIGLQNYGFRMRDFGILIVIPILLILQVVINTTYPGKEKIISLIIVFLCHTLLAMILAVKHKHMISFTTRYSHFVLPYAHILLALGIEHLYEKRKWLAITSLIFIIGLSLLSLVPYYRNTLNLKPKVNIYKEFAKVIEKEYTPSDIVWIKSFWDASLISLYLGKEQEFLIGIDASMKEIYKISKNAIY